jgi:putative NADH-flavin reductase
MRVAIIGGTGFVGSYLVNEAREQGHEVSLLVRPGSEHKILHPESIRIVSGSINAHNSINDVVAGCEAVIYCVGILRALLATLHYSIIHVTSITVRTPYLIIY